MLTLSNILVKNRFMYRQSTMEQDQENISQEQFFTKLNNVPVVNYTWSQMYTLYQNTKEYNPLLKSTLNMTESSLKTVAQKSMPLVEKYKSQIDTVNSYACQQLDKLEETYPTIKRPAEELIADGKTYIQPTIDRVDAVRKFTSDTVNKGKDTVTGTVNGVKDFGMNQVNRVYSIGEGVVNKTLETTYGQLAVNKANDVIDLSEMYVDKYLPDEKKEVQEVDEISMNPISRAVGLTTKVRHRMYKKAMNDFKNVKMRSDEALDKLNFTVNLIDYAKSNIDTAKVKVGETMTATQEKLVATWHEINVEPVEGEKPTTVEGQALAIARRLTSQIKHSAQHLTAYLPMEPGALKQQIDSARTYSDELYTSFKNVKSFDEISTWTLNQAKEKVVYLQQIWTSMSEQIKKNAVDMVMPGNKELRNEETEIEED